MQCEATYPSGNHAQCQRPSGHSGDHMTMNYCVGKINIAPAKWDNEPEREADQLLEIERGRLT